MDDDQLRRLMAASAAQLLQEAVEAARRIGDEVERVTGFRVIAPERPGITDARRPDLERMRGQVLAGERALTLALRWVAGGTLGNVMKTMPPDAADELTAALREAGLMAPEDA